MTSKQGRMVGGTRHVMTDLEDESTGFEARTAADPSVLDFLARYKRTRKTSYACLGPSWRVGEHIHCLLWASVTQTPLAFDRKLTMECWNVTTGKQVWTRPHFTFMPMLTPDAAVHLASQSAAVHPLMEIISLADGSTKQKLKAPTADYGPDDAAWWHSRCIISPDGVYAAYYGQGRNNEEFMFWRMADGELLAEASGFQYGESENIQLPAGTERSRIGDDIPRVLAWEEGNNYVAVQSEGGSLEIFESMTGKKIIELPNVMLLQNWYNSSPVQFALNRKINRIILGHYLLDATTWEVLLELPRQTLILDDWKLVVLPTMDGRTEFVHLPTIGPDGKSALPPRNMQEVLLFHEYGL